MTTVTRVSDLSQNQLLIAELGKANQREAVDELQVSSGKKAQSFADLGNQSTVLFSAKRVIDRNDHYTQTTTQLSSRLDTQGLALQNLEGASSDFLQNVTDAIANNSGLSLMDQLNGVFQQATAALNTQVNGQYIFGGTRTDVAPVSATSIDQLVPAASVPIAGIFNNNNGVQSAAVNDGVQIAYNFTASDLATPLMTALQNIKEFNDTNPDGPLGEHLTPAQAQFLSDQIASLKQISTDVTAQSSHNGVLQQQVDSVSKQLASTKVQASQFVSDIEDADLPTAITNLQQDQLALQAAARMAANIGQMSLLNYLPAGTL